MTNSILNVALIGYGYAGKTFHAPLISSCAGMKLTRVVSSDSAKVLSDFPGMQVVNDAAAVFNDPAVDIVVIATPNSTHFDLAARALKAGKHVVVDKPLALSTDEARSLFQTAAASGKLLSPFQNRRWDADFLTLKRILSTGKLGEVVYFQSNFDRFRPEVRARWREQAIPGSGLWFDLGSHLADQVVSIWGAPEAVQADLRIQREGGQSIDYFHAVLSYGRRRVVLHGASLVVENTLRFTVHGTKGSYVKHGLDTQEESLKTGGSPGTPGWGMDQQLGQLHTLFDGKTAAEPVPNELGSYECYYDEICNAINSNAAFPVSADEALTVMRILDLGIESANAGKVMQFAAT